MVQSKHRGIPPDWCDRISGKGFQQETGW